jgi:GntR family transcriptional regulator
MVAADLRGAIESGDYPVGSELPTALELAAKYQLVVGTVSRALGLLRSAGMVEVSRGQRAKVG